MKKRIPIAFGLLTILLISCQKEKLKTGKDIGWLTIDIGLSIDINEVSDGLKSTGQTEDFKVTIFTSDGSEAMVFETASEMPDTIELKPGDYYVEAHSDNNLPAAFENPYYYGVSEVFTLNSNAQHSVEVSCSLANTIISVVYSDTLRNSFSSFKTTVSSSLGSLEFTEDETRLGYFQTLPLNIMAQLAWLDTDGSEKTKTLSGQIPDPQAGRHYEIHIDAAIDNGQAMFQLVLDESPVPVEVIDIGGEPVIQPIGAIGYGELLIAEIMADPSALSDTEGEWFEIYNNSDHSINLENLVVRRDETNSHTVQDPLVLSPGEYYVMARTITATDAPGTYVYGTSITLPNAGAELAIYNEDTGSGPGSLIFSVDYGGAGFPSASGSSICLDPEKLNAALATSGTSWCESASVYNTGDSGTPGQMNDPCH